MRDATAWRGILSYLKSPVHRSLQFVVGPLPVSPGRSGISRAQP